MAEETGTWLHAARRISLVELSEASGLSLTVIRELVEFGALAPADPGAAEPHFAADCIPCLRRAVRLGTDLELETQALALVVSFLQRIERLESELHSLQARLGG